MSPRLIDNYARAIDYLRVSITDRCNLRCVYCMPEAGIKPLRHDEILRFEEITRLVGIGATLGIRHIRLTGGEPLVRKGVVDLVRMSRTVPGIESISMTSNGIALAAMAHDLAQAGLKRINVSLDTLDPDRYRAITRWGELHRVLDGIEAASVAGLNPVKINVVVVRGVNEDQVIPFAQKTMTEGWHVRFIEFMPLGQQAELARQSYVSTEETRTRIEQAVGGLVPARIEAHGPARTWRLPNSSGTIGFISALSEHFCASCNRLRLTSDGNLVPCLFSDTEYPMRELLRRGAPDEELQRVWQQAITNKPAGHALDGALTTTDHQMSRIGG